jgi:5-methylcytosine-specific restriction protein A
MARYNKYQRDPASKKRYDKTWRHIRDRFLAANPLCEVCKAEGKLTPASLVHHRKPLSEGGTNDWGNLQSLCCFHHNQMHKDDRWGR